MGGIGSNPAVGSFIVTIDELNEFQEMMQNDLAEVILDTEEMAINVRFSFMSISIPAFFDETGTMVDPDTGVPVMTNSPMLRLAEHLFVGRKPKKDDYVNVKGTLYDVVTYMPDGAGMAEIALHKR